VSRVFGNFFFCMVVGPIHLVNLYCFVTSVQSTFVCWVFFFGLLFVGYNC
jgi:hypothetical protein